MAGSAKLRWTPLEDALLHQLVMAQPHRGDMIDWHTLSLSIPSRTPKQCRERWNGSLNPELNNSPWTTDEIDRVYAYIDTLGTKWNDIATHLGTGRSGLAIRNLYYAGLRREKRSNVKQGLPVEPDHRNPAHHPHPASPSTMNHHQSVPSSIHSTNTKPSTALSTITTSSSSSSGPIGKHSKANGTKHTIAPASSVSTEGTSRSKKPKNKDDTITTATTLTSSSKTTNAKKRGRPPASNKAEHSTDNGITSESLPAAVTVPQPSSKKSRKTVNSNGSSLTIPSLVPNNGGWMEPTDPFFGGIPNINPHSRFGAALKDDDGNPLNVVPGLWIPPKPTVLPNIDTATVHQHHSPSHVNMMHSTTSNGLSHSSEHDPKYSDGSSSGSDPLLSVRSTTNNTEDVFHHFVASGPLSTSSTSSYLALQTGNLTRSLQELNHSRNSNPNEMYSASVRSTQSSARGRGNGTSEYATHMMYSTSLGPGMTEILPTPMQHDQEAYNNIHNLLSIRNGKSTNLHNGTEVTEGLSIPLPNDTPGMRAQQTQRNGTYNNNHHGKKNTKTNKEVSPTASSIPTLLHTSTTNGSLPWNTGTTTLDSLTPYHGSAGSSNNSGGGSSNLMLNTRSSHHQPSSRSNNHQPPNLSIPWNSPTNTNNNNINYNYTNFVNFDPLSVKSLNNNMVTPSVFPTTGTGTLSTHLSRNANNTTYHNGSSNSSATSNNGTNSKNSTKNNGTHPSTTSSHGDNDDTSANTRAGRARGKTVNTAAEVLANLASPTGFGAT